MSDIREAFEALNKYRKAYDEMYQMLGMFLDADEGLEKPDIDEAWAAFNLAPGPVYWKAIEAALSADGGDVVPLGYVSRGFAEGEFPPLGKISRSRGPERVGTGGPKFEVAVYTHPAPPSVAVPEQRDSMIPGHFNVDECRGFRAGYNHLRKILTAAPSPDHSGEANKMVNDEIFKAFHASLCRRFGYTHDEQYWWRDLVSLEEHIAAKVADHIADAGKVAVHRGVIERLRDISVMMANGKCGPDIDRHIHDVIAMLTSATPSVPENEIKARALEEYADQLDAVFANAQEAGATDCPAWHAGQFAKDARKQAARLRTAGDEGEEV